MIRVIIEKKYIPYYSLNINKNLFRNTIQNDEKTGKNDRFSVFNSNIPLVILVLLGRAQ